MDKATRCGRSKLRISEGMIYMPPYRNCIEIFMSIFQGPSLIIDDCVGTNLLDSTPRI